MGEFCGCRIYLGRRDLWPRLAHETQYYAEKMGWVGTLLGQIKATKLWGLEETLRLTKLSRKSERDPQGNQLMAEQVRSKHRLLPRDYQSPHSSDDSDTQGDEAPGVVAVLVFPPLAPDLVSTR